MGTILATTSSFGAAGPGAVCAIQDAGGAAMNDLPADLIDEGVRP